MAAAKDYLKPVAAMILGKPKFYEMRCMADRLLRKIIGIIRRLAFQRFCVAPNITAAILGVLLRCQIKG